MCDGQLYTEHVLSTGHTQQVDEEADVDVYFYVFRGGPVMSW